MTSGDEKSTRESNRSQAARAMSRPTTTLSYLATTYPRMAAQTAPMSSAGARLLDSRIPLGGMIASAPQDLSCPSLTWMLRRWNIIPIKKP